MERKIVIGIMLFVIFCNALPFFSGVAQTPAGTTYLGAVHYPIDYYYYLSSITQGKERFITTRYLLTAEPTPPLFMGWLYVPFGRVGSIVNLDPKYMYQIMLVIFGFLYLYFAYWLINLIFPKSSSQRIIAFLLFIFSNTFPRIIVENGVTTVAQYYSWFNYGEPFIRIDAVPHQIFIHTAIFMMLIAFFSYPHAKTKLKKTLLLTLSAVAGLTLGSTQPVQWVLLSVCLFPLAVYGAYQQRKNIRNIIQISLPYLLFSGIGFICAVYLEIIFSRQPFKFINGWEAQQSPYITLQQFIMYYGPVFVLGVIGLPWFLKRNNMVRRIIAVITIIGLIMFALPFSKRLPIMTLRYLSALPVLLYAASATEIIYTVANFTRKFKPMVIAMTLTLLAFLLLPLFARNVKEKMGVDLKNTNYYLATDIYNTFLKAGKISTPNDTFLILWPFQTLFPAISGRREYFASEFATPDFQNKNDLAYKFVSNHMSPTEMETFFHSNHITYVLAYPNTVNPTPLLTALPNPGMLVIYKVN